MKIKFKGYNGKEWLDEYCRMGKYGRPRVEVEYIGASGKRKMATTSKLRTPKSMGHHVWRCIITIGEGSVELEHSEQSKHKKDAITQCYTKFAEQIAKGNM